MTILYAVREVEGPRLELRHEEEATGRVAAVFADVRRRLAFTPALFEALAVDPPALERAWAQARALLDEPGLAAAAARLRAAAAPPRPARPSAAVRAAVAPFDAELPGMLLVVSSLGLALDGRLPLAAPPPLALPAGGRPPEPTVPALRGEHPLYAEIRALYGTAHVPSLYRSLAARGLLEQAWRTAGPLLVGAEGRARVARVARAGEREALRLCRLACFDAESARGIVEQFRVALPRNLVVVTALSGAAPAAAPAADRQRAGRRRRPGPRC